MSLIRISKPIISDIQEQAISMLGFYTLIIVKYASLSTSQFQSMFVLLCHH